MKCFVLKVNGTVNNSSLLEFGMMYIPVNISSVGKLNCAFQSLDTLKAKIKGDSYFTDSAGTSNLGKEIVLNNGDNELYMAPGEFILLIPKYVITKLGVRTSKFNIDLPLENFKYSNLLTSIAINPNDENEVNINILDGKPLTHIYINGVHTSLVGDIAELLDNNNLTITDFYIRTTKLSGDIAVIGEHISGFGNNNNYSTIIGSTNLTGNIVSFINSQPITNMYTNYASGAFEGDFSLVKSTFEAYMQTSKTSNFTWKHERDSTAYIITFNSKWSGSINFGEYLDAMLINQAACIVPNISDLIINVTGNKTSASDAAVTTLIEYGYSVIINGTRITQ